MQHDLKCWPDSFEPIANGLKSFDWRKDDRGFAEGDFLVLKEWINHEQRFTGREVRVEVTFILRGPLYAVPEGYVVMSIRRVTHKPAPPVESIMPLEGSPCGKGAVTADERVLRCTRYFGHGGVHAYEESGRTIARWGEDGRAVYFTP